jgi:hypothetical protein
MRISFVPEQAARKRPLESSIGAWRIAPIDHVNGGE